MRIVLTGGGTLGSVTPLLAIIPALRAAGHELYFIGTQSGPEKVLVEQAGVPFHAIRAPKLRRYVSWRHLLIPSELVLGVLQSFGLLMTWQPQVIVSAGSFVSVPVVLAAARFGIPCVIHQQDVKPGLAIRLMRNAARRITVVFEDSLQYFPAEKTEWIGNPVRDLTPTTDAITLNPEYPTILVFGGGTGAQALNTLVTSRLWNAANVIHLTGKGKHGSAVAHPRYHQFEFLNEEMKEALHKADVVVARAGLGTISELAALGKPAIIIPMPETHQEENAELLKRHDAAIVLDQKTLTQDVFAQTVSDLLKNKKKQEALSKAIRGVMKPHAAQRLVEIIQQILV